MTAAVRDEEVPRRDGEFGVGGDLEIFSEASWQPE
jgi:hypothetical protein